MTAWSHLHRRGVPGPAIPDDPDRSARNGTPPRESDYAFMRLFAAPVLWAVHFVIVYGAAAVYCEQAGVGAGPLPASLFIGAATAAALGAIALAAFPSARQIGAPSGRFLAGVTLALAALSAVAVVFTALPILYVGACR